ncbi:hypothetical protein [Cellulosilyticum lentocellum]|uniref:Uncharacterized protein n=1 Tax=Cellulosilyticum lentocellum (strain ATCC 49066 / DSM 5427 / NCIMB 11756 / RHM5) TaxID=642492 RepID=F2JH51_CELLD|nr:hypothetical protein [Cellulosilyticum lentocellum]ADZ81866.1 hypothetical protein Clole_0107 [Cellulosilyticum lentocellum DSM 5427]
MLSPRSRNAGQKVTARVNTFYLLFEILTSSIGLGFTLYIFISNRNLSTRIIMAFLILCLLVVFLRSIILLILYFLELKIAKIDPLELSATLTNRKTQLMKAQSILTKMANITYLIYDYGIFIVWFILLAFFDYICLKQFNTSSFIIFIISLFFWAVGIALLWKKLKKK